ncbi:solute carrier family 22 member 7-like [Dermacentor albipictus]|uniref:solute carrier family 22 member 7-like n=1 Tax=Dermacentor albipictus TaxID=60249 RepID=UPI0038FBEDF6
MPGDSSMSKAIVFSEATEPIPARPESPKKKLVTIGLATSTESSRAKDETQPDDFALLDSSVLRKTVSPSEESNLQPDTSSPTVPRHHAYTITANSPPLDMDRILGSGLFQWVIVAFANLSSALVVMHHTSMQTFLLPVAYWCRPPADANVSVSRWKAENIPLRPDGTYSQCTMYPPEVPEVNGTRVEVACTEWQFDLLPSETTIVSEWNLVCDRAWYVPAAFVYNRIGVVISVLFFGQISDRVGRLPAVYACTVLTVASAGGATLARTFINFIAARILLAASLSVLAISMLVIMFENSGDKHREGYFCLAMTGTVVASVLAQTLTLPPRNYKALEVVTFSLTMTLVPVFYLVGESISWLLVSNNVEQAEKAIRRAAAWNNHQVNEEGLFFTVSSFRAPAALPKMNFLTFLASKELWKRNAVLCWTWFSILLPLYGMSLSGRSYEPSHLFFLAVMRAASILLFWIFLLASPRKILLTLALPLTCCMLLLYGNLKAEHEEHLTWILGEIIVSMLLGEAIAVNVFTLELYPTVVRGIGFFVANFFGQLGATLGPLLAQLQAHVSPTAASVFYFAVLFTATFLIRLLPETKRQKTPQTLQDILP